MDNKKPRYKIDALWHMLHGKVVEIVKPYALRMNGKEFHDVLCVDNSAGGLVRADRLVPIK